jgi:hypothetical protein
MRGIFNDLEADVYVLVDSAARQQQILPLLAPPLNRVAAGYWRRLAFDAKTFKP